MPRQQPALLGDQSQSRRTDAESFAHAVRGGAQQRTEALPSAGGRPGGARGLVVLGDADDPPPPVTLHVTGLEVVASTRMVAPEYVRRDGALVALPGLEDRSAAVGQHGSAPPDPISAPARAAAPWALRPC